MGVCPLRAEVGPCSAFFRDEQMLMEIAVFVYMWVSTCETEETLQHFHKWVVTLPHVPVLLSLPMHLPMLLL